MPTRSIVLLLALVAACGGGGKGDPEPPPPDAEIPLPPDAALPDAHVPALYEPAATYPITVTTYLTEISYTDEIGLTRAVPIAVYTPTNAPTPMPFVLLSHGGAQGKTDPLNSMDKWAPRIAQAGYTAIAIAHVPRMGTAYDDLCTALGVQVVPCAIKLNWDRPHDVAAVLDWLEQQAWATVLDFDRIAHMGHSAGAGGALMLGGVPRNYVCSLPFGMGQGTTVPCDPADLVPLADSRIDAVIAFSPQGPDSDGFMPDSFPLLDRPLLMATGLNDGDPGEPASRLQVFDLVPEGGRWLVYVDDVGARHTLFEAEVTACVTETMSLDRCNTMIDWLEAAVIAFLDSRLRELPDGDAWLGSGDLEAVSAGDAEVSFK